MVDLEELPGVGPAIAKKLEEAGYDDLMAIAVASPSELADAIDIGEGTALKIIQAAREKADVGGFETGDVLLERMMERKHLTTGSKSFDDRAMEIVPDRLDHMNLVKYARHLIFGIKR